MRARYAAGDAHQHTNRLYSELMSSHYAIACRHGRQYWPTKSFAVQTVSISANIEYRQYKEYKEGRKLKKIKLKVSKVRQTPKYSESQSAKYANYRNTPYLKVSIVRQTLKYSVSQNINSTSNHQKTMYCLVHLVYNAENSIPVIRIMGGSLEKWSALWAGPVRFISPRLCFFLRKRTPLSVDTKITSRGAGPADKR